MNIADSESGTLDPDGARFALRRLESLEALRPGWPELAERSGNVFATWEWLSAWWRHFGRGRELLAFRCERGDGSLAAILPLYVWRRRPRVLRFLGHGPGDELGPVCAPEERARTLEGLRRLLAGTRWSVFVGDQLSGEWRLAESLGARVLRREGSPVLELNVPSWDDLLATLSHGFRSQIRRDERNLLRDHGLVFRRTEDPARLEQDLDLLFDLHRLRWPDSDAFAGTAEPFQRDFARTAFQLGWLRLWFLELEGRAHAAWYGLRFGGADSFYQGGRDPAWQRPSLGITLVAHTIREAVADGMSEYRFLRGGEGYKYRFSPRDAGLETIVLGRGPAGRAGAAALRLRFRRTDDDQPQGRFVST